MEVAAAVVVTSEDEAVREWLLIWVVRFTVHSPVTSEQFRDLVSGDLHRKGPLRSKHILLLWDRLVDAQLCKRPQEQRLNIGPNQALAL